MRPSTLIALLCLAPGVRAQVQAKPAPATFRLVSEVDAVVPGAKLTLGLRIDHQPGWHTYWKNPGTVGMATRVKWTLPEGCSAGPLQWQLPQRTKMGIYTVWGYEGRALLLTDVSVPKTLAAADKLEFTAEVSYMVCAKRCNPGHATVSIVLPLREKSKPVADWPARFAAIRRQQPRALDRTWQVAATRSGKVYTLTLTPKPDAKAKANRRIGTLAFFGEGRLVSSDAPQEFHRDGERLVLRLRREKFTPGDGVRLRGLLYSAAGFLNDGTVTALAIDTPIGATATKR